MAGKRKLEVEILSTEKGDGFKRTERSADSFGRKMAGVGKTIALGLGVAAVGAVAMGVSFVHAAEESIAVGRQTNTVIESMGNVAGISATGVADLAESLAMKTGIDDEVIQSGENVLLTFGNIRNELGAGNDIFNRATTTALDMSVALGTDLSAANIQLGKALNDPIKGITALTRSGVSFSQQQKDQITDMVKSGDLLGAQKLMLGELDKQFGGSAEAQATASGKMSVAWGNLQEELGMRLMPVFNVVSGWIMKTGIPALESLSGWVQDKVVPVIQDFAGWVGDEVVPVLQDWGQWMGDHVVPVLQDLGNFLTGTVIPALGQFAGWLNQNRDVLVAVGIGAGAVILGVLVPAFIAWAVAAGAAAIATLVAAAPFILVGAAIAAFAFLVIHNWSTIKSVTITVFNAVRGAIAAAFNWVKTNWPLLLAILTGPIGMAVLLITRNWNSIKAGATAVKNWIVGAFNSVVSFFTGIPGRIASAASGMWDGISNAFKSMVNKVLSWWNGISFTLPTINIPGFDPPGPGPSFGGATIGGQTFSTPNIPLLHSGGMFRAPRGQREGLAMLLDGETVVPPGAGAGTSIYLTVHVAGSVRSDRELVDVINEQLLRGAVLENRGRRL